MAFQRIRSFKGEVIFMRSLRKGAENGIKLPRLGGRFEVSVRVWWEGLEVEGEDWLEVRFVAKGRWEREEIERERDWIFGQ